MKDVYKGLPPFLLVSAIFQYLGGSITQGVRASINRPEMFKDSEFLIIIQERKDIYKVIFNNSVVRILPMDTSGYGYRDIHTHLVNIASYIEDRTGGKPSFIYFLFERFIDWVNPWRRLFHIDDFIYTYENGKVCIFSSLIDDYILSKQLPVSYIRDTFKLYSNLANHRTVLGYDDTRATALLTFIHELRVESYIGDFKEILSKGLKFSASLSDIPCADFEFKIRSADDINKNHIDYYEITYSLNPTREFMDVELANILFHMKSDIWKSKTN